MKPFLALIRSDPSDPFTAQQRRSQSVFYRMNFQPTKARSGDEGV
jgi:hypothetical protein